jgi:hypothetical protein
MKRWNALPEPPTMKELLRHRGLGLANINTIGCKVLSWTPALLCPTAPPSTQAPAPRIRRYHCCSNLQPPMPFSTTLLALPCHLCQHRGQREQQPHHHRHCTGPCYDPLLAPTCPTSASHTSHTTTARTPNPRYGQRPQNPIMHHEPFLAPTYDTNVCHSACPSPPPILCPALDHQHLQRFDDYTYANPTNLCNDPKGSRHPPSTSPHPPFTSKRPA